MREVHESHVCIAASRASLRRNGPGDLALALRVWPRRGRRIMWKIATSAAAIGLSLCLATAADARGGGGGGGHLGGGGGGHFGGGGGGGAHFGGGGAHFGGGGAMRMGGGAVHMGSARMSSGRIGSSARLSSHMASPVGHPGRSAFHAATHGTGTAGARLSHGAASVHAGAAGAGLAPANQAALAGRGALRGH